MEIIASIAEWLVFTSIWGSAGIAAAVYFLALGIRKIIPKFPDPAVIAGLIFFLAILTLPSIPRYQFEKIALSELKGKEWIRIIHKATCSSMTEPLTWFSAPVCSIFTVMPNSQIEDGYREVLLRYDEEPYITMTEPNCSDHTILYSETDNEGLSKDTSTKSEPMTTRDISIYCDYDWTKEKEALALRVESAKPKTPTGNGEVGNIVNNKPSPELLAAINEYQRTVGVLPAEFLAFTVEEQEAYIRGAIDAYIYIISNVGHPDLESFIGCFNQHLPQIISSVAQFTEKEGRSAWLMPWTLSSLVGKTCPPEIREAIKEKEYIEAGTGKELYKLTRQLQKKTGNGVADEESHYQIISERIDDAFIRGVLDGQFFSGYGLRMPGLIDLLHCYNRPKTLYDIFSVYRSDQVFDPYFGSRIKSVFYGVRFVCESVLKKEKDE